mgnify:CR=1 FL=1
MDINGIIQGYTYSTASIMRFKDGHPHGTEYCIYLDNTIYSIHNYDRGRIHGKQTTISDDIISYKYFILGNELNIRNKYRIHMYGEQDDEPFINGYIHQYEGRGLTITCDIDPIFYSDVINTPIYDSMFAIFLIRNPRGAYSKLNILFGAYAIVGQDARILIYDPNPHSLFRQNN